MADSTETELWKSHRTMQEKLIYFLLAAAGACIGFALTQAKELKMEWAHAALGIALGCWALSFWFGYKAINFALDVTWYNVDLLKARSGKHPMVGASAELKTYAEEMLLERIGHKNRNLGFAETWQMRLLILGVFAYVTWQILLMNQRTI